MDQFSRAGNMIPRITFPLWFKIGHIEICAWWGRWSEIAVLLWIRKEAAGTTVAPVSCPCPAGSLYRYERSLGPPFTLASTISLLSVSSSLRPRVSAPSADDHPVYRQWETWRESICHGFPFVFIGYSLSSWISEYPCPLPLYAQFSFPITSLLTYSDPRPPPQMCKFQSPW